MCRLDYRALDDIVSPNQSCGTVAKYRDKQVFCYYNSLTFLDRPLLSLRNSRFSQTKAVIGAIRQTRATGASPPAALCL
jgi:hypothetical protein